MPVEKNKLSSCGYLRNFDNIAASSFSVLSGGLLYKDFTGALKGYQYLLSRWLYRCVSA